VSSSKKPGKSVRRSPKCPPVRPVFIDVDGTLVIGDRVNDALVAWIREKHQQGVPLVLWSARGERYARQVAERLGIADLFDHILSKPGYVIDDLQWSWIRFTRVIDLGTLTVDGDGGP